MGSARAHLVVLALGILGFALLALGYEHEPLATVDEETASWAASSMPVALEWAARPFSWLGGWVGLTALGIVAGVLLVRERAWVDLGFFLTAFLGSQLAVMLLKEVFDRPRPDFGSAVALPASAAFPSGHAMAGVASLGALVILASERMPPGRPRAWLWSLTAALGVAIGLSRVVLGVHFVTDVVAGWCLGLAWLAGCLLLRDLLRGRSRVAAQPGSTR